MMLIFMDEIFILFVPHFGGLLVVAKLKSGAKMTPRIHACSVMPITRAAENKVM